MNQYLIPGSHFTYAALSQSGSTISDIKFFLIELVENVTNFSPLVFFLIDCSVNGSVRLALWLLCVDFIPWIYKNCIYQFE